MPTRVSEKHLFTGIALLLASMLLAFNTTLFATPIRIYEKGLVMALLAGIVFMLALWLIARSIHRHP